MFRNPNRLLAVGSVYFAFVMSVAMMMTCRVSALGPEDCMEPVDERKLEIWRMAYNHPNISTMERVDLQERFKSIGCDKHGIECSSPCDPGPQVRVIEGRISAPIGDFRNDNAPTGSDRARRASRDSNRVDRGDRGDSYVSRMRSHTRYDDSSSVQDHEEWIDSAVDRMIRGCTCTPVVEVGDVVLCRYDGELTPRWSVIGRTLPLSNSTRGKEFQFMPSNTGQYVVNYAPGRSCQPTRVDGGGGWTPRNIGILITAAAGAAVGIMAAWPDREDNRPVVRRQQ